MQCLALRQAYVSAPVRVARRSRAGAVSRRKRTERSSWLRVPMLQVVAAACGDSIALTSAVFGAGMLVVKAHEEEEVLPIWSGRVEVPDPETLHRGPMLGGKTLGEELGERL